MGYYTYFNCRVIDEGSYDNEYIKKAANRLSEIMDYDGDEKEDFNFISYDSMKWYECEDDMKKLSKEFPDMVFEISADGEESDDFWMEYFLNGDAYYCRGRVVFDPPPVWAENKMSLERMHAVERVGNNG